MRGKFHYIPLVQNIDAANDNQITGNINTLALVTERYVDNLLSFQLETDEQFIPTFCSIKILAAS